MIYKNYKWQLFVKMRNPLRAGIFGVVFPLGILLIALLFILAKLFNFEFSGWMLILNFVVVFGYEYHLRNKVAEIGIDKIIMEFEKIDKPREKLTMALVLTFSLLALFSPILVLIIIGK